MSSGAVYMERAVVTSSKVCESMRAEKSSSTDSYESSARSPQLSVSLPVIRSSPSRYEYRETHTIDFPTAQATPSSPPPEPPLSQAHNGPLSSQQHCVHQSLRNRTSIIGTRPPHPSVLPRPPPSNATAPRFERKSRVRARIHYAVGVGVELG